MKKFWIGILFLLVGCSSQKADIPEHIKGTENLKVFSADAEPSASIELAREATYMAPDRFSLEWFDETVSSYSWFGSIEIDNSGRVFIADDKATKIHVFDPDGNYLQSIGGKGRGPGEFQSITDTQVGVRENELYVFDLREFRTTTYSLDSLQVIKSESVKPPVNQDDFDEISGWRRAAPMLRSNGTYLAGFMEQKMNANVGSPKYNLDKDRPRKYYLMNRESKLVSDKIFEIHKAREILTTQIGKRPLFNIRPMPFLGRTIIRVSNDNHIYTTWTDDFLIKVYSPDGTYQRAIYYPFPKKPISKEQLITLFDKDDRNRKLVENAELPKNWPVIRSMTVDDQNRLWVSTIVEEDGVRQWWVLENTGELVAKFRWPDNRSIKAVKNGNAYAVVTDQDTGQQKIVKYRVKVD